jgi:hypothetical protein
LLFYSRVNYTAGECCSILENRLWAGDTAVPFLGILQGPETLLFYSCKYCIGWRDCCTILWNTIWPESLVVLFLGKLYGLERLLFYSWD